MYVVDLGVCDVKRYMYDRCKLVFVAEVPQITGMTYNFAYFGGNHDMQLYGSGGIRCQPSWVLFHPKS